jgi:hypothetical protein
MPLIGATDSSGVVYADASDVAEVWRPLSPDEIVKADALCKRASVILRSRVGMVDQRIGSGQLDPDLVNQIVAEWVVAVMRNPDGFTQENEGGYGYSRFGIAASTGLLMSSMPDLTSLLPGAGSLSFGTIFTAPDFCGYM